MIRCEMTFSPPYFLLCLACSSPCFLLRSTCSSLCSGFVWCSNANAGTLKFSPAKRATKWNGYRLCRVVLPVPISESISSWFMCAHNHTEPRPSKAVHLQASIVTFSKLSYLVGSQALHVCTEVTGRSQAHAGLQMSAVFVCCAHTWPELMAMRLSFLKSRPGKDAEFGLCSCAYLT